MFCSNCGREIGDNSKFCNFCGLPISQPISQPVSQQISEQLSQPVFQAEDSITEASVTVEAVENTSEPITETVQSVPVTLPEPPSSIPIYSAPQPENIPNMGAAVTPQSQDIPNMGLTVTPQPYNNSAPLQAPGQGNVSEKPMPERKYTLGHIIMCLAAVAVMAIVAGIFAGLYFAK